MPKTPKDSNWKRLKEGRLNWEIFRKRSQIIQATRSFFEAENFLEIDAPLLTPFPTLDSNILSVPVTYQTGIENRALPLYLHSSPEHAMKKLLAAGGERLISIDRVFRDGEQTLQHNGEFTMVEWYRKNANYLDIMEDTEKLICHLAHSVFKSDEISHQGRSYSLTDPWPRRSVRELFQTFADVDLNGVPDPVTLKAACLAHAIPTQDDDTCETLYFRLFLTLIEPQLGLNGPEFVINYPASMGLMAQRQANDPQWVERAELYIGGMELANGYSELTDPAEQLSRFEADASIKYAQTGKRYPIDHELIEALSLGLPRCAGMALGLDRLIMLFLDKTDIQDVLLFPIHQY